MAVVDLSDTLVIGITATALFDLSEADKAFCTAFANDKETAIRDYRVYMLERENDDLQDGTGMPLVEALLGLNQYQPEGEAPLVQVVVMSRNSPETGLQVLHNIRRKGL
ncbi:MAG: 5'-nucleotidase, partial [Ghiorsea sp.]|nr:5'-nucleotidase [Ghiorsea sp.]